MGLALVFKGYPSPLRSATGASGDIPDDRLRARMYVDDFYDLLTAALKLGKCLGE